jgi:hypothetical protein
LIIEIRTVESSGGQNETWVSVHHDGTRTWIVREWDNMRGRSKGHGSRSYELSEAPEEDLRAAKAVLEKGGPPEALAAVEKAMKDRGLT